MWRSFFPKSLQLWGCCPQTRLHVVFSSSVNTMFVSLKCHTQMLQLENKKKSFPRYLCHTVTSDELECTFLALRLGQHVASRFLSEKGWTVVASSKQLYLILNKSKNKSLTMRNMIDRLWLIVWFLYPSEASVTRWCYGNTGSIAPLLNVIM